MRIYCTCITGYKKKPSSFSNTNSPQVLVSLFASTFQNNVMRSRHNSYGSSRKGGGGVYKQLRTIIRYMRLIIYVTVCMRKWNTNDSHSKRNSYNYGQINSMSMAGVAGAWYGGGDSATSTRPITAALTNRHPPDQSKPSRQFTDAYIDCGRGIICISFQRIQLNTTACFSFKLTSSTEQGVFFARSHRRHNSRRRFCTHDAIARNVIQTKFFNG